jgi:hypothetical protein
MNVMHPPVIIEPRHHAWFDLPAQFRPDDLQAAIVATSKALTAVHYTRMAYDAAAEDFCGRAPGAYDGMRQAIRLRKAASARLAQTTAHQVAVMASYGIGPGWWPLGNGEGA